MKSPTTAAAPPIASPYSPPPAITDRAESPSAARVAGPPPAPPREGAEGPASTRPRIPARWRATFGWPAPVRSWSWEEETFIAMRRACPE